MLGDISRYALMGAMFGPKLMGAQVSESKHRNQRAKSKTTKAREQREKMKRHRRKNCAERKRRNCGR